MLVAAAVVSGVSSFVRQAVVLVGGKGTRLGALAAETPKPLLPVDAKSVFLDEVLFALARHGFDEILLLAGHLSDQVRARYHDRRMWGAAVEVVSEARPAGTGGALALAKERLHARFLLCNGDTLFDANLRRLETAEVVQRDALAVMALRRVPDAARYGSVQLSKGEILAFREKHADAVGAAGLINAGTVLMSRDAVDLIDKLPCSLEGDIYPVLARRRQLAGVELEGYFIDMGLPETLAAAKMELPRRRLRPALFLDLETVLNNDAGYSDRLEDIQWIPGAIETIRRANDLGALVIVYTNHSSGAAASFDRPAVKRFHAAMMGDLVASGAHIDAFFDCPRQADASGPKNHDAGSPDSAPDPGAISRTLAEWPIDAKASALISDKPNTLEAARTAGVSCVLFGGSHLLDASAPTLDVIASARHRDR